MKVNVLFLILTTALLGTAQTMRPDSVSNGRIRLYVENSLLQAAYNLVSFGAGAEFLRYQVGVNYLGGRHHFSHAFNEVTFVDYGDLHFVHTRSEDIVFKAYVKTLRKGFYGGLLLNILHWKVEDHASDLVKPLTTVYIVPSIGYRWFPFKKIFYLDGSAGLAYNLRKGQTETIGNTSYRFNPLGLEFSPNFSIGVQFNLKKK